LSYEVRLRRAAQKQLDTISAKDYENIARVISSLEKNPRPKKTKKLRESGLWRIRIGDFRIVYAIDDEAQIIIIVRVVRRKEHTYKNL
jgi:mRNA interferase RelE/StbE